MSFNCLKSRVGGNLLLQMPFTGKKQINNIRKDGMLLMDRNETYFDNSQKYIELGYNIAYYRKHAKLTQEQLAEALGVSRQAVSKWEAEQSVPDIDKIISICDYFGVTTDYILRNAEMTESQHEVAQNAYNISEQELDENIKKKQRFSGKNFKNNACLPLIIMV